MKKKIDLTFLTTAVHLIAVLSAVCFGTIYLSLGILLIPALTSAFLVGKDVIYKQFDVYDSLSKRFFRQIKEEIHTMRYFPIQLVFVLQAVGIYASGRIGMKEISYLLLPCMAFLLTLLIYIISYHVFYQKLPSVVNVIIAMFFRLHYLITVWVLMILILMIFQPSAMGYLLIVGEIPLLLFQTVAFLDILAFKSAKGDLDESDKKHFDEDFIKKI